MAMSVTLNVLNSTGQELNISAITAVNDDPTFNAPSPPFTMASCQKFTVVMANESVSIAPRGVGAHIVFTNADGSQLGGIILDDPAIGAHSFSYANTEFYCYTELDTFAAPLSNTNTFTIVIGLAGDTFPQTWMQTYFGSSSYSLRQISIPGSHDSGMSHLNGSTVGAHTCSTITQTLDIGGQLMMGVRYFDLRLVISAGQYMTGHYTMVEILKYQGANGQTIKSIISEVNQFTSANNELVILHMSQDLDTDTGGVYPHFTQDQWNSLFAELTDPKTGLQHLYAYPGYGSDPNVDLTSLPISSMIGGPKPAVIVIVHPEISSTTLGAYAGQGLYSATNFPLYNSYSDSNQPSAMAQDQIQKMQSNPSPPSFLLSWTLTQDNDEAVTCALGTASSVLQLANLATPALADYLVPPVSAPIAKTSVSPTCYPNIIYTDNIATPYTAYLSLSVNDQIGTTTHSLASSQPSMAWLNGKFWVAYNCAGSQLCLRSYTPGTGWGPVNSYYGFQITGQPSICCFNNALYIAFISPYFGNCISILTVTESGMWNYIANTGLNTAGNSSPILTVASNQGQSCLYLGWQSIAVDSYPLQELMTTYSLNGMDWQNGFYDSGVRSNYVGSYVELNGKEYLLFQGIVSNDQILIADTSNIASNWNTQNQPIGGNTTTVNPSAVVLSGRIYLFFQAQSNNQIIHTSSQDGVNWDAITWLNIESGNGCAPYAATDGKNVFVLYLDGSSSMQVYQVTNNS